MKKLLSLLLCLGLLLGLCSLPALADAEAVEAASEEAPIEDVPAEEAPLEEIPIEEAAAEDAPAEDGFGVPANVFYYNVDPGSVKSPEAFSMEYVEPGGHPASVPIHRVMIWNGVEQLEKTMVWTWYLDPDLSGEPVDPADFTVEELGDELHFYGWLDVVTIRLHLPAGTVINGNEVDVFGEEHINRGDTFSYVYGTLPTGYWAAAWADADGNIIDTENTLFWEDTDLYAVQGDILVTYMLGEGQSFISLPPYGVAIVGGNTTGRISGESLLEPGTPRHVPTKYLHVSHYQDGTMDQEWVDIIGWTDENGNPVDPSTLTITEDRTFYAVIEGGDFPDPKPEGHDLPAPAPAVTMDETGTTAAVTGDFSGLYARAALVLDNGGQSGLYVTQVEINPDGRIVIPAFMVPGLTVTGVNIALVPTLDDITSPKPEVIASATRMLPG